MIYFIRAKDTNLVKIGTAQSCELRLRELQTGSPIPLTLELTIAGNRNTETAIHAALSEKRRDGEWYELDEKEVAQFAAAKKIGKEKSKITIYVTQDTSRALQRMSLERRQKRESRYGMGDIVDEAIALLLRREEESQCPKQT